MGSPQIAQRRRCAASKVTESASLLVALTSRNLCPGLLGLVRGDKTVRGKKDDDASVGETVSVFLFFRGELQSNFRQTRIGDARVDSPKSVLRVRVPGVQVGEEKKKLRN